MTARTLRAGVLLGCLLVALGTAWYAGSRAAPGALTPSGSVRLGPGTGEPVAGYLARLPGLLPPAGTTALALVQFRTEQPSQVVNGSATPVTVVFRVPVARVQTALRFEALDRGATAVDTGRRRAQFAAATDAARLTGRPAAVAAAEAAALADPACTCVLALVVEADRAGLDALAADPAVRAVEAAPPGTTARELALSPLLPEQSVRADPLPDDGPVPTV